MAELEIHHESEHAIDPIGQKVGVLAAILAVLLAIVTISSHRAHTEAVLLKTDANDKWSYYQSKRIKFHSLELGEDLMHAMGTRTDESEKILKRYGSEKGRYDRDSEKAQEQAQELEKDAGHIEKRALDFDFGEGLLEIGLVLTSLYFISRKKLFPVIGLIAGAAGTILAVVGFLT